MQLRVLGAHNMESRDTRMESHLIDGVLALDAGGLTRALTFDEQRRIRAVILSHRHFDHVRDLPPLGLTMRDQGVTVEVYGIGDTIESVASRLLDGSLYTDLTSYPSPGQPGAAAQHRRPLPTVRRARLHGSRGARSPLGAGRGVPDSLRRHTAVLHRRHGQRRQRRVGARLAHGAADRGDLRQRERVEGYSRGPPHPCVPPGGTRNGSETGTATCPGSSSPT